jgi:hypothetical protein
MLPAHLLLAPAAPLAQLTPQRAWLERLALIVPGAAATRWLLVADALCLVAIGLAARQPLLAVPLALGVGFAVLNALGMVVTDFYLGLALFHLAVGAGAAVLLPRRRWVGAAMVALALALGALT